MKKSIPREGYYSARIKKDNFKFASLRSRMNVKIAGVLRKTVGMEVGRPPEYGRVRFQDASGKTSHRHRPR